MIEAVEHIDRLEVEAPSHVVVRGSIIPLKVTPHPVRETSALKLWLTLATDAGVVVSRREIIAAKTSDTAFTLQLGIPENYDEGGYLLQFGSEQGGILSAIEVTVIDSDVAERVGTFNEGLIRRGEASRHLDRGDIRGAIKSLMEATQYYLAAEESRAAAEVHLDIADLFIQLEEYQSADDSARQALLLYRNLGDWRGVDSAHELLHLTSRKRSASELAEKRDEGLATSQGAGALSALLQGSSHPVFLSFAAHAFAHQRTFTRASGFDERITGARTDYALFRSALSETRRSYAQAALEGLALDICKNLASLANERSSILRRSKDIAWDVDTQLTIPELGTVGQLDFGPNKSPWLLAAHGRHRLRTLYLWVFFDVLDEAHLVGSLTSPPFDFFRKILKEEFLHSQGHKAIGNLTPSTFGRSDVSTTAAWEQVIAELLTRHPILAIERER